MTEEIQKNKSNSQALLFTDRIMDTVDNVLSQFTSGRWILTVAAAIVMVYTCVTHIEMVKDFKEIIAVIIYAYFNKGDKPQGGSNAQSISNASIDDDTITTAGKGPGDVSK